MKIAQFIKKNYLLLAILFLGAVLRFYKLDFQSIWLDEIHTMIEGNPNMSYKEFYDIMVLREQMPHFYFLCIKAFSFILGHTTFTVRLFSAIIGVISIYTINLLGTHIYNKKAGLISAALLSVNYFHLWYSQEARPYILFSLFVILSFYRLVVFIKNRNLKNALLYALFTNLMINTHFFGLFVLVSQSLIILFFLFDLPRADRKQFFKLNIIAGIVTLIFWYPSFQIFLQVAQIKSFWIQPPTLEVYTQFFKDFFGNAEMVFLIVFLVGVFYFVSIFNQKKKEEDSYRDIPELFSFIILIIWIFITLYIPFVRTYLDIPMLISRYFIGVLPAVIVILAIGMAKIKNQMVQIFVVSIFILASTTDIIVVKDYYNKINKTQFREITTSIISKNAEQDKVVSSFGWLMSYFLNLENHSPTPIEGSLEDYILGMKNATIPLDSFWYADANARPYNLSKENEAFLNENFYVKESLDYFDTWAKHYISKKSKSHAIDGHPGELNNSMFKKANFDQQGHIMLFENSNLLSDNFNLEKGDYELTIEGNSQPLKPINNVNAHIKIRLNGKELKQFYLSENTLKSKNVIRFNQIKNESVRVQIIYDNDTVVNGLDRNAVINLISLKKE